jgi:hypothetical protein
MSVPEPLHRPIMERFYRQHDPSRVGRVPSLLAQHGFALLSSLVSTKYGGRAPLDLWESGLSRATVAYDYGGDGAGDSLCLKQGQAVCIVDGESPALGWCMGYVEGAGAATKIGTFPKAFVAAGRAGARPDSRRKGAGASALGSRAGGWRQQQQKQQLPAGERSPQLESTVPSHWGPRPTGRSSNARSSALKQPDVRDEAWSRYRAGVRDNGAGASRRRDVRTPGQRAAQETPWRRGYGEEGSGARAAPRSGRSAWVSSPGIAGGAGQHAAAAAASGWCQPLVGSSHGVSQNV